MKIYLSLIGGAFKKGRYSRDCDQEENVMFMETDVAWKKMVPIRTPLVEGN